MSTLVLKNGVTIATEALAEGVSFDDKMIHCELKDGRIISVPLSWYPRLQNATEEQRNNWQIIAGGDGISWPDLDEDLSIRGFMAGSEEPPADARPRRKVGRAFIAPR
jgi:hypothetical protein